MQVIFRTRNSGFNIAQETRSGKAEHYLSEIILIFGFLDFRITEGIKTYRVRHYLPKKKIYRR